MNSYRADIQNTGRSGRVLVTGGTGFVGSHLTRLLLAKGFQVRITGRARSKALEALGADWMRLDLAQSVDWGPVLEGVDAVVHLAGIAHQSSVELNIKPSMYEQVNHLATRSLVSAIRGDRNIIRFLYVSSVAVHGDRPAFPLRESAPLNPATPYGSSKVNAEKAIAELLPADEVNWAILRPTLVYGPGNRGNMDKLERLLRSGLPIPLARMANHRSFLFIGNLVAAIETYLICPEPPSGRTWIVADERPASTEELLHAMARSMGIEARVLHLPDWILDGTARLGDICEKLHLPFPWTSVVRNKLLGDYFVDISTLKQELGWRPPYALEEGIALTYGHIDPADRLAD